MRRLLLAVVAAALAAPGAAQAAAPIMPLGEVAPGARCTGLTVVRETDVASFDVEVLDVIARRRPAAARILVRVSGPPVDATGIGPGFSGSPVLCPDADGLSRTIGAISETIGEFGGRTVLATPIESILAQPPVPPAAVPAIAGSRALAAPLTIAGLRPSLAASFVRAASRAGRVLVSSPAGPRVAFEPRPLEQGSAVVVGLTAGDVSVGALGTVSYVDDGGNAWLFGHPLDGAGRRSLFLQDAFIHTVINNPIAVPDVSTYKLSSPGHDIGMITSDGPSAVVGTLGALPPSFPLRVTGRDSRTGRVTTSVTRIADEGDVGRPTGISPLGLAGPAAVAEVAGDVLTGSPSRQTGDLCVKVTLRELRRPLRFCNTYAVEGQVPNALAGAATADMAAAVALVDGYKFGTLHPTAVEAGLRSRAGVDQAFITGGSSAKSVRRGAALRVRLRLRHTGSGRRSVRTIRVPVPLDTPAGVRTIRLAGTPADVGGNPDDPGDLSIVFEEEETGDDPGPQSLQELRSDFEDLARFDGVTATIAGERREVFRDPRLRITGTARVRARVLGGGRTRR